MRIVLVRMDVRGGLKQSINDKNPVRLVSSLNVAIETKYLWWN